LRSRGPILKDCKEILKKNKHGCKEKIVCIISEMIYICNIIVSLESNSECASVDVKAGEKWHKYWKNTFHRSLFYNVYHNRTLPLKWKTCHGRKKCSAAMWRGVGSYGHLLWTSLKNHVA
jgi:hypothetical protein